MPARRSNATCALPNSPWRPMQAKITRRWMPWRSWPPSAPLCPTGKATERGRIVQNIFVKYYAGSLQPYLAQVDQRGQAWSSSLRSLSSVTQIPPATLQYLQRLSGQEASLWADFQQATARHVRSWQEVLNSCGLAPGQSGWNGNAASADQ